MRRRWVFLGASAMSLCAALVAALIASPTAGPSAVAAILPARADDAVRACDVTEIDEVIKEADVPPDLQEEYFMPVPTATDPVVLLCGNGSTTGAVHIEVKHDVPNWGDAINCMENAIINGKPAPGQDRTEYHWRFGSKTMVVVVGEYSMITAYPPTAWRRHGSSAR